MDRASAFSHRQCLGAAVIALGAVACAGLSACATDNPSAVSGSATQKNAPSAWVHTPNQPNYFGLEYRGP
jgi:hypothetical protein